MYGKYYHTFGCVFLRQMMINVGKYSSPMDPMKKPDFFGVWWMLWGRFEKQGVLDTHRGPTRWFQRRFSPLEAWSEKWWNRTQNAIAIIVDGWNPIPNHLGWC